MTKQRVLRTGVCAVLVGLVIFGMPGCGSRSSVPATVEVTLPDGSVVDATMGAGVISLANTSWDFYAGAAARGTPFVRVRFGDEGNLEAFEDNTIASEIFGATIAFDGERHSTSQSGLTYSAATYGAETSDASGFTFEGRLSAFAAGFEAAAVTATATAEFDPDDPNVVSGTFYFKSEVLLFADMFPDGNAEDEFAFIGQKVVE